MSNGKNKNERPKYRHPNWGDHEQPHPLTGRYYDTFEMMQVMHVTDRTLLRWRNERIIPFKKVRSKIYYLADAVDQMMREDGDTVSITKILFKIKYRRNIHFPRYFFVRYPEFAL